MLYLESTVLFTEIYAFIVFSLLFERQPMPSFCSPTIIFFTSTKSLKKAETLQDVCSDAEFLEGSCDRAIIPAFTPREESLVREGSR